MDPGRRWRSGALRWWAPCRTWWVREWCGSRPVIAHVLRCDRSRSLDRKGGAGI